ncbi:TRAM domain-containing protein [Patescibacteria group bacterium]|nr:TRAM domain-containing protein [Patescibacteria group bacterium]
MSFWQIFGVILVALLLAYFFLARKSLEIKTSDFVVTILGVVVGLSIGALLSLPLARLSYPFGQWLPLAVNIFTVAVITTYFYNKRDAATKSVTTFFTSLLNTALKKDWREVIPTVGSSGANEIIIDTSSIIDGRILEIVRLGFINEQLVVPKFILKELQGIADSANDLRRSRGRRGLDVLSELKKERGVTVKILDSDFPSEVDVDAKIIKLAKKLKAKLMTVDYNLNRVAQIQNIVVLNVNELNNALRPVVLPGETLNIKLVQGGKDRDQGVGYLDDGTMVVVEGGHRLIGKEVEVSVTRIFQTIAGKMIFAVPQENKVLEHQES